MFYLITGGAASGKSEYAENLCLKLPGKKLYVATMKPFGQDALEKIARHKAMRNCKGFETLEKYNLLFEVDTSGYDTVLIECMSNLLANEFFTSKNYFENIVKGIETILNKSKNLLLITNKVFSDGVIYDDATMKYMEALGRINRYFAEKSDVFHEIICGIPVVLKGENSKCTL